MRLTCFIALFTISACHGADDRPGSTVLPRWQLGPEQLGIGSMNGPESEQFFRVAGVVRRQDGGLVVADGGSGELRFFARDGTHLSSVGRIGEGPGEFRALDGLWAGPGDSLFAWDRELARLSVFDARGQFGRLVSLEAQPDLGSGRVEGVFGDGSLLVASGSGRFTAENAGRVVSGRTALSRFDADGQFEQIIDTVAGPAWYGFGDGDQLSFWSVPFTHGGSWAVAGSRAAFGDGGTATLRVIPDNDGPSMTIRWPEPDHAVTASLRDRYGTWLLGLSTSAAEQRQIRQFLAEVPMPASYPVYDAVVASPSGGWWVRRFPLPADTICSWLAFGRDGTPRARVAIPCDLRVAVADDHDVIGITGGDEAVERVVVLGVDAGS